MPSSVVARIQYNPANAVLKVIFVSGMIYNYKDVPEEIYQAMKNARSKGTYLNKFIKGNYEFKKVN